MLWQKSVREGALFVTNGGDDVLRLLRHLVQEQVDHTQTPLPEMVFCKLENLTIFYIPDVNSFLRAQLVGDV